jgi:uncharacterized membrane protein YkvA (DUF1232 family)
MLNEFRSRLSALKTESQAVFLAARDPRTPGLARIILVLVAGYAISPLDLIPDFIPVFGYIDDFIIVPAGIRLALKLIPPEVMADARLQAQIQGSDRRLEMIGTGIIVLLWILAIIALALVTLHLLRHNA